MATENFDLNPWETQVGAEHEAVQNTPAHTAGQVPGTLLGEQKYSLEAVDLLVEFFCRKQPISLKSLIETIEVSLLLKILHQVHGNQKKAAKLLGIKYTTLNEKVKRYGIRFKKSPVPYAF